MEDLITYPHCLNALYYAFYRSVFELGSAVRIPRGLKRRKNSGGDFDSHTRSRVSYNIPILFYFIFNDDYINLFLFCFGTRHFSVQLALSPARFLATLLITVTAGYPTQIYTGCPDVIYTE